MPLGPEDLLLYLGRGTSPTAGRKRMTLGSLSSSTRRGAWASPIDSSTRRSVTKGLGKRAHGHSLGTYLRVPERLLPATAQTRPLRRVDDARQRQSVSDDGGRPEERGERRAPIILLLSPSAERRQQLQNGLLCTGSSVRPPVIFTRCGGSIAGGGCPAMLASRAGGLFWGRKGARGVSPEGREGRDSRRAVCRQGGGPGVDGACRAGGVDLATGLSGRSGKSHRLSRKLFQPRP
jgi:hypothetical protein